MSKSFHERKVELITELISNYAPQKKSFWNSDVLTEYKSTKEIANGLPYSFAIGTEKVFKTAVQDIILVFLIFFGAILFVIFLAADDFILPKYILLVVSLTCIMLVLFLKFGLKPRVKMIFDNYGLRLGPEKFIKWADIVATYIESVTDEVTSDSLIIHYYDSDDDDFKIEKLSISGIDADKYAVSGYIEYFKRKSGIISEI
jgi:hypothetical protein